MAKMGRPPIQIDQKQFEQLCGLQCTELEICDWFGCSDETLNSWCKKTYGKTFLEVFRQKRNKGKSSLRRNQWKLAETNATMAIFLGKQYLGQRDVRDLDIHAAPLDESVKEMQDYFDASKNEDVQPPTE